MTTAVTSLLFMLAAFIVAIGILVSVHEFGHFWVARRCGIRVLRFSVGFGKPIWKRVAKDGVEYVIGSIPLGGYVKMLDEREGNVSPLDAPYSYNRAKPWKRILTLLAGPFANLLFAVLAYWVLLMIGIPSLKPVLGEVTPDSIAAKAGLKTDDLIVAVQGKEVVTREAVMLSLLDHVHDDALQLRVSGARGNEPARTVSLPLSGDRTALTEPDQLFKQLGFDFWYLRMPAVVGQVVAGGAAEQAGLQTGDRVVSIDGEPVADFQAMVARVSALPNREVMFQVERGSTALDIKVKIGEQTTDGRSIGRIGVGAVNPDTLATPDDLRTLQKYGPLQALTGGVQKTWDTSAISLKMMAQMVLGKVSTKNLSGPISIAEYTGVAARQGLRVFAEWLALISISIGIFNLLPLPMLDGGQIVYQLIELLKGSPVSERVQMLTQQVGLAMLLMLLSLTLYNDIARHF
jgi:regulator of sigma E protease